MVVAKRFIIRGRVQGVGYRYFAITAGQSCRVTGTVRNLPDGSVEVVAEGTASALAGFRIQLQRGPSFSRVTFIDEMELEPTGRYLGFNIVY